MCAFKNKNKCLSLAALRAMSTCAHLLHTSHQELGRAASTCPRTFNLKYAAVAALRGVSQLGCKRPLRKNADTGP